MKKILYTLVSLFLLTILRSESVYADTDAMQGAMCARAIPAAVPMYADVNVGLGIIGSCVKSGSEGAVHYTLSHGGMYMADLTDKILTELVDIIKGELLKYTRAFGDTIAERVMENERVKAVVRIVEFACYAIICYFLLVTGLLIFILYRLYNKNLLVLKLLEERKQ